MSNIMKGIVVEDIEKWNKQFTKSNANKTIKILEKLNIKIAYDTKMKCGGTWEGDNSIIINPNGADVYTVLHEIGHVICGHSCCREHCEFEAHGAAKAIARIFDIKLDEKHVDEMMKSYAGRSSHKACGRINP